MTDELRRSHLIKYLQVGLSEVGLPDIHLEILLELGRILFLNFNIVLLINSVVMMFSKKVIGRALIF